MPVSTELLNKIADYESKGYSKQDIVAGLSQSKNYPEVAQKIFLYKSKGYSDDDILDGIKQSPVGNPQKKISSGGAEPEWAGKHPNLYGLYGAAKEIARFGGETAGLVGGGMLGAPLGIPGIIGGAALGYGGVKQLGRVLEGEKATIPQAVNQALKDVGTGAMMEMGGQGAGKILGGLINKITRPGISDLHPSVVQERVRNAKQLGIELSPAEATESKGLALYESMLDKAPFSTGIVNKWRLDNQLEPLAAIRNKAMNWRSSGTQTNILGQNIKEQVSSHLNKVKAMDEAQLNALRDNVSQKLGSTKSQEDLGQAAQKAIAEKSEVFYDQARQLYSSLDDLVPKEAQIPIGNTQKTAERLLKQETAKLPSMQDPEIMKVLRDFSGSDNPLVKEANSYPEPLRSQILSKLKEDGSGLNWQGLQATRSELNSRIAQNDAAIKSPQPGAKFQSSPAAGVYKQLRKSLDADIEVFANSQGGDLKDAFELANAFYKKGKNTYNSDVVKRMIKTNPEKLVDFIFRPKGGTEIDALRNAIGSDFNRTIKPAIANRLLGQGQFSPAKLSRSLEQYGDEVLGKVFNAKEIEMLKGLATDGKIQIEQRLVGEPFFRTLANERPEVIVDSILGSYDRFPGSKQVFKNVLTLRSAVDKPTMDALKLEMTDRIFKVNALTDQIQPEMLAKNIQKYDKTLNILYTKEQVDWLKNIAKTGKVMASAEALAKNPSGTAQNVITWGTWGALFANPIKGALTSIIAPKMFAKWYLSPIGRKYFTEGLKTPAGTTKGIEIGTKLAEIAGYGMAASQSSQEEIPTPYEGQETKDQQ